MDENWLQVGGGGVRTDTETIGPMLYVSKQKWALALIAESS